MAGRVTMREVAQRAGVSAKTVSNVLRGAGGASPATRERVHTAVRALGYRVNPGASALRSGRHGALALAVPSLQDPVCADLAARLMRAAGEIQVVLELTRAELDAEGALLAGSWRGRCDGLVLVPRAIDPAAWQAEGVPGAVVLVADGGPAGIARVACPPRAQAELAARHVRDLGRRTAAVLGTADPTDHWTREAVEALRGAGVDVPDAAVVRLAAPAGMRGGVEAVSRLLRTGLMVDALVCHDDAVAAGATATLLRRGARVPQDVAVIGRGDTETAAFSTPALTSVSYGGATLATEVMRLLGPDLALPQAEAVEVAPELAVRASSVLAPEHRP